MSCSAHPHVAKKNLFISAEAALSYEREKKCSIRENHSELECYRSKLRMTDCDIDNSDLFPHTSVA